MCKIVYEKANRIFPAIKDFLEQGIRVRITVTGMSMYPFLRGSRDLVELEKACLADVKKGDIVLIRRENGEYILHRIIRRKENCFFIVGDAQQYVEGPLKPDQLVAKAAMVGRNSRWYSCSGHIWRLLGLLWLFLIPFRHPIIKGYHSLHNAFSLK